MAVVLTFERLSADELQGSTVADFLIAIDAYFKMSDGALTVLEDPEFPVVELARNLNQWLNNSDGTDFSFDSMSYEEAGVVTVKQSASGWVFGSVFAPDVESPPNSWAEVEQGVRTFVSNVAQGLLASGVDPRGVLLLPER